MQDRICRGELKNRKLRFEIKIILSSILIFLNSTCIYLLKNFGLSACRIVKQGTDRCSYQNVSVQCRSKKSALEPPANFKFDASKG